MTPKQILQEKLDEMQGTLRSRDALKIENVSEETELTRNIVDRDLEAARMNLSSAKVKEILDAMGRVESGEYGVCIDCENPIAERRLAAVPWAKRCIRCQERHDQGIEVSDVLRDDFTQLAA